MAYYLFGACRAWVPLDEVQRLAAARGEEP